MRKAIFICAVFILLPAVIHAAKEQWEEHKSQHFIIYYKNAPIDFINTVADHAERYYDEISLDLGFTRYRYWHSDKRAQIYIYDSARDFQDSGKAAHWASGAAMTRSKIIRSFPTAHGFFDSTLPHELGHIIFREFIGHDTRVPLWLEEGVAMYQEKAKRWGSTEQVRQAIERGEFMPVKELNRFYPTKSTQRKKVDLFYAEAASIVYYLIQEQGTFRFVRLCRKLQDGVLFEEAFETVYSRFKTPEALNKAWLDYIQQ